MKFLKNKLILCITSSLYLISIDSHSDNKYIIKDINYSIYKPIEIKSHASNKYQFTNDSAKHIRNTHGKILESPSFQEYFFTPFGSLHIYTAINDTVLSSYDEILKNFEKRVKEINPQYNIKEIPYIYNFTFLPNQLFISVDGGITYNEINKDNNEQLDTLYLEKLSENGEVLIGYAKQSKSILKKAIDDKSPMNTSNNCNRASRCYAFFYHIPSNQFTLIEDYIEIKKITKDGAFFSYKERNNNNYLYIYDTINKSSFILNEENINKYLLNHPEKDILSAPILKYPFINEKNERNISIDKISDNKNIFIGQLDRDLEKKQLKEDRYSKIAFITKKDGPIKEIIPYDAMGKPSEFGESKLLAMSADGNYSVGWGEFWHHNYRIKLPGGARISSSLFSQALLYNFAEDKLHNIGNLSKKHEERFFRNARAKDISADGRFIVGWSETDLINRNNIPVERSLTIVDAYLMFHRHGFLYFDKKMYDLGTLDGGNDSEALSITDNGQIIYGLSTDQSDNWRQVIWKNNVINDDSLKIEKASLDKKKENYSAKELAEKETQKRADAEKQRLANEERAKAEAEKQRLANTERAKAEVEKQRLANEERTKAEAEKQRLANEERAKAEAEKQRLTNEERMKAEAEKQRLAEATELERQQQIEANKKAQETSTLVVSKPIDIENTYRSIQETANSAYQFINLQQGRLRYIASATCDVGTEKACISGFAHYQHLDKAKGTQTGISGAYRFDLNKTPLVVGLAIDTDIHSSLPKGYQYQGYPLPLIGFSVDLVPSLNKAIDNNTLHLSLKGAYLNRKLTIERQPLSNTEMGKGQTKISGYHLELEGYYPYSATTRMTLTPFAGVTFNHIARKAYHETEGATFIAHYNQLNTHSLMAKMGLGLDYLLTQSLTLNTKAGMFWQFAHHQGDFLSHIDYLGQQRIDYKDNKKQLKQRPFANMGMTYQFDKHSSINTSANWEMTTYRYHDLQLGMSYTYRF